MTPTNKPLSAPSLTDDMNTAHLGQPMRLGAATRAILVTAVLLPILAPEPLRDYMSFLPLWMNPVDVWLIDATKTWYDWMASLGATAPYDWIRQTVEDLRTAGAVG